MSVAHNNIHKLLDIYTKMKEKNKTYIGLFDRDNLKKKQHSTTTERKKKQQRNRKKNNKNNEDNILNVRSGAREQATEYLNHRVNIQ